MSRPTRHVLMCLATLALSACVSPPPPNFNAERISDTNYVLRVDGFLLVLDASGSMGNRVHHGQTCLAQGRDIVHSVATAMIGSIPELDYRAGVRSFGQGECISEEETSLLYGMSRFARGSAQAAADKLTCSAGGSPLGAAFRAAIEDFGAVPGRRAVIVVSDGLQMSSDDVRAAAELHHATGACIYAVQVGDSKAGRIFLEKIVTVSACGTLVSAHELEDGARLTEFVTMALLQPATAKPTSKLVVPKDSDGDGVTDDKDKCPDTPRGAPVGKDGCEIEGVKTSDGRWRVSGEVLFESNSAQLRPESQKVLNQIAEFLQDNESVTVTIEGHTDSMGAATHNMDLSQRRAQSAVDYLVAQGVAATRLTSVGKGETEPTAPNDTPAKRGQNRRVEFIPSR